MTYKGQEMSPDFADLALMKQNWGGLSMLLLQYSPSFINLILLFAGKSEIGRLLLEVPLQFWSSRERCLF